MKYLSTRFVVPFFIVLGLALSHSSATEDPKIDRIVVEKSRRKLTLFKGNQAIKTYRIALGKNPEGHKIQQGDGRTPEGAYRIDYRNPESAYHLSLHISYPNKSDIQRAKGLGVSPGGDIMIHGIKNGLGWLGSLHRLYDWTDGCIAVTNAEIEEIWASVPDGTVVEINP